MRYGLNQKPDSAPAYSCEECKAQDKRNCRNIKGYTRTLLSKGEWRDVPASLRHVEKWGDLKLFECPLSVISAQTWEILRIVNATTNADCDVQCLPFAGTWLDQPSWYRQAVEIVKRERGEHRRQEVKNRGR